MSLQFTSTGERRLRVVQVSQELIFEWFTQGWHTDYGRRWSCTQGLPEGAVYVGSYMDGGEVFFVFYHPSFEAVGYLTPPPRQPVNWSLEQPSLKLIDMIQDLIRSEKEKEAQDVAR